MKSALVLALSLAVAGGAGFLLLGTDDDATESADSPSSKRRAKRNTHKVVDGADDADGYASGSDEELEARVARLERRVRQLEAQSRMGGRGPGGERGPVDLQDPENRGQIHEVVEDALADARENERAARDERRRERMKLRNEEALAALVEAAGIAGEKSSQIAQLWEGEGEQLADLFRQAREGELDFRTAREQAEAIRAATDAAAKEGMSEEQQAAYDENRPGPPRGGRGGRGGRG